MDETPADTKVIDIFYKLPLVLNSDGTPDLNPSRWSWTLTLRIPMADLQAVQPFPVLFKCIRFASYTIFNVRGHLSTSDSPSSPDIDYDASLPRQSVTLYYHYADDTNLSKPFPTDPDTPSSASFGSSNASLERHSDFREDLMKRDDARCCITEATGSGNLEAAHLVTRARGNAYFLELLRRRGDGVDANGHEESTSCKDELLGKETLDIDNPRNGLILNRLAHGNLGNCLAFLRTPNFTMDTTDIDPTAAHPQEPKVFAQALHKDGLISLLGRPNNAPLRLPADASSRPYPVLFDYTYASAFLARFGIREAKDAISTLWKNHFCPVDAMNAARKDGTSGQGRTEANNADRERRRRNGPGDVFDAHDFLMLLPYWLIPPERLEAVIMAGEARKKAELSETVNRWRESIPPTFEPAHD